ncbi:hypothetical protein C8J56DRAFT_1041577 [Mycena floridula]|nr:hypothetical protein C8J56DRAFT_1041577 [Mycena floridula]
MQQPQPQHSLIIQLGGHYEKLWSWQKIPGVPVHQRARVTEQFQNHVHFGTIVFDDHPGSASSAVVLKIARGRDIQRLTHEAEFYQNELRHLQGSVLPRFFGIYYKLGDVDVACMMLERCVGEQNKGDMAELGRQIMVATSKIHQAGVCHRALLDAHHIIPTRAGVRIVDFALAARHQCQNALPMLSNRVNTPAHGYFGCEELLSMEQTYGAALDHFPRSQSRYQRSTR